MWRVLDLRTGEFFKLYKLVSPKEWELWATLKFFEKQDIADFHEFLRNTYDFDQPISPGLTKDIGISNMIDAYKLDNYLTWQEEELIKFCLSCTITEHIIEEATKKKLLLYCHKAYSNKIRHFYEVVEVNENGQIIASDDA